MAERPLKASSRRTTRTDLYRLTGPFQIHAQFADTGTEVHLAWCAGATPLYLDADVVTGWVGMAPLTTAPYLGTRWVLQNNGDGTWSFLNQGQPEHMLAGSGDTVTLGRPPAGEGMERFSTTRWLIYHDLTGVRLRPVMGVTGWLGVRDAHPVLAAAQDMVGPWIYWQILPLPTRPVASEETLA